MLVLTLSGDVSDYTPAVRAALRSLFAELVGVALEQVLITVEAGSVVLRVEILSSAAAASTVLARLQAAVSSPADATSLLSSVPGITITVLSVDSLASEPLRASARGDEGNAGAIAGGVVGGVLGLILLGALAFQLRRGKGCTPRASGLAKVVVAPPEPESRTKPSEALEGGNDTAPPSTNASEAAPAPAAPTPTWDDSRGANLAVAAAAVAPKADPSLEAPAVGALPAVDAPAPAPAPTPEVPTGYDYAPAPSPAAAAPAASLAAAPLPPIGGAARLPPLAPMAAAPGAAEADKKDADEKKDDKPEKGHRSRSVAPM